MNVASTLKFDLAAWAAMLFRQIDRPGKRRDTKSRPSQTAIRARRKRERQARRTQQRIARSA